jgi:5-methylcytosine-specific restriction endonuclease McrA
MANNSTAKRTNSGNPNPRRRGRYVPAAVRRAVWKRDGGRCTYVDSRGRRCRETSHLELHHEEPHARKGLPSASNMSLRCRVHNALAAEQDFGREFVRHKKRMAANRPEALVGHFL